MNFLISDTFTSSLGKLNAEEQKATKTTAFDFQLNPANLGHSFHRIDKSKDPHFWSVRVNKDIRMVVHKTSSDMLLCYVDHHDKAYDWAEKRKLERHPRTGAAQFVEIRERVREIEIPQYVTVEQPVEKKKLFEDLGRDAILGYGVPEEWVDDVLAADEDSFFAVADHLPAEASEALLTIATGGTPAVAAPIPTDVDAFEHPDAMRRFRVLEDKEELEAALDYPWEKWSVFLHPAQREFVEGTFDGPARVSGSAGTGKTIVALHRAVVLARKNIDARVLLTTFSPTLARNLSKKLKVLTGNKPRTLNQIEVVSLDDVAERLYRANIGELKLATEDQVLDALAEASSEVPDNGFTSHFLKSEWNQVVDPWQLRSWEEYKDVKRLGRLTRLPESRREILWKIFAAVRKKLKDQGLKTKADMYKELASLFAEREAKPYDFAVVDESQDVSVTQLRFLAALSSGKANGLFFAGDLGQRIFRHPFSWLSLGVDVRGRSKTLRVNYRTSHQIRVQADRLLAPEIADVDGLTEERKGTVSIFNGPAPEIASFSSARKEIDHVGEWVSARIADGIPANEICVCVRSADEVPRAESAVLEAGAEYAVLDESDGRPGAVSISTMHRAKGLEFKAMAIMACDDEVIPSQERIEQVADESELEEVYNTERHLLYVACTRARDHLLVTGVDPVGEFVEDIVL